MPIYEYRCAKCGNEFEEWQKITDPPSQPCEVCGGEASRLISASTFILKGTGWYVTDYARKDEQSDSKPKKVTKPPEEKKSSSESVTKTSDSSSAT
jgi:putative FmdB family regulatory protein